jgi:hypothetical protein
LSFFVSCFGRVPEEVHSLRGPGAVQIGSRTVGPAALAVRWGIGLGSIVFEKGVGLFLCYPEMRAQHLPRLMSLPEKSCRQP